MLNNKYLKYWITLLPILIAILIAAASSTQTFAHGGHPHAVTSLSPHDASCGAPDVTIVRGTDSFNLEECLIWTFDYGGTTKTMTIYWTEVNGELNDRLAAIDSTGDGIADMTPLMMVEHLAQWTEEAWRTYKDYGFNDPLYRDDIRIHIHHSPDFNGWCCGHSGPDNFYFFRAEHLMNTLRFGGDFKNGQTTAYHEMWHASQYSYNKNTCFTNEGTASAMTDHVNIPVDLDNNNDYISHVNGYLSGGAFKSLTRKHCYDGALFWKYFMEQIGTTATEPQIGMDAFQQFWDELNPFDDSVTTLPTVDSVTRDITSGARDLHSLWVDFAVTNYAKELTSPSLPTTYRYIDEQQAGGPDYPPVRLDVDQIVTSSSGGLIATTDVEPWAARYYQLRPASDVPFINIEMSEDSGAPLTYVLLRIKDDGIVSEERHVGSTFTRSFANDDYDKVVVIVVAHEYFGNFRYSLNGTSPTFNIVDPVRGRAVEAGDPTDPDKIMVRVEALSPTGGGTPISGIDPANFMITIGGSVVSTSDYVSTAYIAGQYWLLIQAPPQDTDGFKTLRVDYGSLNDTELEAVHYHPDIPTDNIIIIDKSASMAGAPLQAAKDGAILYVDSYEPGDGIGVIAYNSAADRIVPLDNWSTTLRDTAHTEIGLVTADGSTSIGNALLAGMDELDTRGLGNMQWTMVLLSDGNNTSGSTIDDFITAYRTRLNAGEMVPKVHTIALGPSADRAEMQRIAQETNGNYSYASAPSLPLATTEDAAGSGDLASADSWPTVSTPQDVASFLELSEVYRVIAETVVHEQQVYYGTGGSPYDSGDIHSIQVDIGADELVVVVKWLDEFLELDSLAPVLRDPNGVDVGPCTWVAETHCLWRISNPDDGIWEAEVAPFSGSEFPPDDYMVEAAVKSDLTMDVFLGLSHEERLAGQTMPILVTLAHNAPVTGATILGTVTRPNGSNAPIILFNDDGYHGDGAANDGIYGAYFTDTYYDGSFKLVVTVTGSTPATGNFVRRTRTSFDMTFLPDDDGDGIPNWWEIANGSNPSINDTALDIDYDGLNLLGEFQNGTNPNDSDSDNGGEGDGSEVSTGGHPLDGSDDLTPCVLDFQVSNSFSRQDSQSESDGVALIFEIDPDHVGFTAWRADSADGPRSMLATNIQPNGLYIDNTNLVEGNTYYYWLQAIDIFGFESCILGPRSATYHADGVPPEGYVQINDGQMMTDSPGVTLSLSSGDADEMLVSNSPDFVGAVWEPFAPTKPWTLSSMNNAADEVLFVYVMFRDASGNESSPLVDGILLENGRKVYLPVVLR